jgi:hypothetical protein
VDFISGPSPQPKRQKIKTEEYDFFMFKSFQVSRESLIGHPWHRTYTQKSRKQLKA